MNNPLEGWHRSFDRKVAITHSTLCRLVDRLRKEHADNQLLIEQVDAGVVLPPTKKYEYANQRVKNVVENYHNTLTLEYLRAIAHNLYIIILALKVLNF